MNRAWIALMLAGIGPALDCDAGTSCPEPPCAKASDGDKFDLVGWCEETGRCESSGMPSPRCPDAANTSAPGCGLRSTNGDYVLAIPVGDLKATLGGRRELTINYGNCDRDAAPPEVHDVVVDYDGVRATGCTQTNPCVPGGMPTYLFCKDVPPGVKDVRFSMKYGGAEGKTQITIEMIDPSCSNFCVAPPPPG